ncbi:MAG: CcdB antidote CcdA [Holophagaceae bacterium]|nr:CcdB antidote CcdA [Holophagaceae bacterium]
MQTFYHAAAPKKPVNVSLNSDLLRLGRGMGLNVSAIAEEALVKAVQARLEQSWLEENAEAIQAFNERVEARGVYSDGLRSF